MKTLILIAALGLLAPSAMAAPAASPASNGAATTVVKNFYGKLTATMQSGSQVSFADHVKNLQPAVDSAFNMPVMTKLAVGPSWTGATPDEQHQLITAFSEFSAANYARNFAQDNGEQFTVLDEKTTADGVMVDSKIEPKTGDAVPINYLLRQDEQGKWRIVDVFLNGSISELSSRRADFSGIAQRDGIPALINNLDEKSKALQPG